MMSKLESSQLTSTRKIYQPANISEWSHETTGETPTWKVTTVPGRKISEMGFLGVFYIKKQVIRSIRDLLEGWLGDLLDSWLNDLIYLVVIIAILRSVFSQLSLCSEKATWWAVTEKAAQKRVPDFLMDNVTNILEEKLCLHVFFTCQKLLFVEEHWNALTTFIFNIHA